MLENLIEIQNRFQLHLRGMDYTFIGPLDLNLLQLLIAAANELAPIKGTVRTFRDSLADKEIVLKALKSLPENTRLRIYVVDGKSKNNLFHSTIEDYCRNNKIDFIE